MKALKHLNKYFKKYKWMLILGILFIAISNYFAVLSPSLVGDSIDDIANSIDELKTPNADRESIIDKAMWGALWFAGLFMIYALLKGLFLFFTRQTIIVMSRYIEYDLKHEIFNKYQQLSLSFYRKNNTGDLMNRISEDVSRVRMYLGPAVMYITNLVILGIMIIYKMISINPELTLYVLTPLPLMGIIIFFVSKTINLKSDRVQSQQSVLTTHAQETFSGIRVIKTFGKEESIRQDFHKESELYKKNVLSLIRTESLFHPVIALLIGLSTILTVYIGCLQYYDGGIPKGTFSEFVIYINMLTWPFATVGWVSSLIQQASASQNRINEFLTTTPDIVNENVSPDSIVGSIEFKNVSFVYPESGIHALNDVSFKIEPGETLAIVGKTGSGKSTIAALVARLFDATDGEIKIDNRPIKSINLDVLRSEIGYVPQDVFLFSDTIANNIAFGLKDHQTSKERIEQAAKDADVLQNILEFKEQFETIVGERGITLSGGQKQRISIARAIIREPKILLFDDCLSAVDTETEDAILGNLKRIMKGKSSLIISHRISTVKHADKILVLKNGSVIEHGTHQSLIDQHGYYFDLHRKQLLEEEKIA